MKKGSPLESLAATAMARHPKQTIHLRGKHAQPFHKMKVGSKVSARMHGTLQNAGIDQYNDNEPTAEISLDHFAPDDQQEEMTDKPGKKDEQEK